MEQKSTSFWESVLTAGILGGLAYSLVLYILVSFTTLTVSLSGSIAIMSLVIVVAVMGILYKNKNSNIEIPFGKAYGHSLMMLMLGILLAAAFFFLMAAYIDVEIIDRLIEETLVGIEQSTLLSDEQKDEAMDNILRNKSEFTAMALTQQRIIYNMILALIAGLIIAVFSRNKAKTNLVTE